MKGPTASIDAVLGHEGFLVGAEAGYDVQKAALTKYSAAVGFSSPEYSAAVTASNSLSVFAASYYHKVNSQVEAGAKATWDSKKGEQCWIGGCRQIPHGSSIVCKGNISESNHFSKSATNPFNFYQAKVNDRGIAALAYNIKMRPASPLDSDSLWTHRI